MEVVTDILSEREILDMPAETLSAFAKVMNTNMKAQIAEYMSKPDSDPAVRDKLYDCAGEDITGSTFHLRVKDSALQDMLRQGSLKNLPMLAYHKEIDLNEFIEKLEWLAENEGNIRATLPSRDKNDYNAALELITFFQNNPEAHHDHDLPMLMKVFKSALFCPMREKPQNTGIRSLSANKNYWKMQLKAAKYLRYCLDNNVSYANAREC